MPAVSVIVPARDAAGTIGALLDALAALDPVDGINCPERDQAVTKEIMAERSRVYWVLADSSKLSRPANFPHWCRLGAGRGLIVDGGGPDEVLAPFEQAEWVVARARG